MKNLVYLIFSLCGIFVLFNSLPYLQILSIALIMFLSIIIFVKKKKISRYNKSFSWLLMGIYLYMFVSYLITGQSIEDFFSYDFIRRDGNIFFSYMPFFIFSIVYFKDQKFIEKFLKIIVTFNSIICLEGIFDYFFNIGLTTRIDSGLKMFVGFNDAHNATGSVLSVLCIIAYCLFVTKKNKINLILFSCLLVGLVLTKSRGSILAIAVSIIFINFISRKNLKIFLKRTIIVFSIFIIIVGFTGTKGRIQSIMNDSSDNNISIRYQLWNKAFNYFKLSPIIGIGFGRFDDINISFSGIEGLVYIATDSIPIHSSSHAHNSYLHFIAEIGIVGLTMIMYFWIKILRFNMNVYKKIKNNENSTGKLINLISSACIVDLFILSFTEHYMAAPTVMILISSICSISLWSNDIYLNIFSLKKINKK